MTPSAPLLVETIGQIITSVEHPFKSEESTGPARFSLLGSRQPTPSQLLSDYVKQAIKSENVSQKGSVFYPLSVTKNYPTTAVAEIPMPITYLGNKLQSVLHIDLTNVFNIIKQLYAKLIQILLFIGLPGMVLGYSFKKNILHAIPVEYIALSISGLLIIVGQTVLPASAIDYGLYRLFQQNLTFLSLPIMLGFLYVTSLVTRSYRRQIMICAGVLLFFLKL